MPALLPQVARACSACIRRARRQSPPGVELGTCDAMASQPRSSRARAPGKGGTVHSPGGAALDLHGRHAAPQARWHRCAHALNLHAAQLAVGMACAVHALPRHISGHCSGGRPRTPCQPAHPLLGQALIPRAPAMQNSRAAFSPSSPGGEANTEDRGSGVGLACGRRGVAVLQQQACTGVCRSCGHTQPRKHRPFPLATRRARPALQLEPNGMNAGCLSASAAATQWAVEPISTQR